MSPKFYDNAFWFTGGISGGSAGQLVTNGDWKEAAFTVLFFASIQLVLLTFEKGSERVRED